MPFQRQRIAGFEPAFFFEKIRGRKLVLQYPKGTVIYTQGEAPDAVYYLQAGQVTLTVCSPTGKEAIIGILGPGDFLGEGCLVGQRTHIATALATRDSTVVRLEKTGMASLLRTEQKFSEVFLSFLLTRKVRVEGDLVSQVLNSTDKRLARALLLLAPVGKRQRSGTVIPRVTHETLAQMIGATRAQVSTLMNEFRKRGFIHYDGELRVNKSLVEFALNG